MTPKIIFKNLDYICHKSVELQKNLKHIKFWKYFYWKHDKATLIKIQLAVSYNLSIEYSFFQNQRLRFIDMNFMGWDIYIYIT